MVVSRPSIANLVTGVTAAGVVVTLSFSSGGYFPADHGLLNLGVALDARAAVLVRDEVSMDRR